MRKKEVCWYVMHRTNKLSMFISEKDKYVCVPVPV